MNRAESLMRVSSVTSDDAHGMRLAIQHLHSLGHRRIGHLAGPQHLSTGFLRSNGLGTPLQRLEWTRPTRRSSNAPPIPVPPARSPCIGCASCRPA